MRCSGPTVYKQVLYKLLQHAAEHVPGLPPTCDTTLESHTIGIQSCWKLLRAHGSRSPECPSQKPQQSQLTWVDLMTSSVIAPGKVPTVQCNVSVVIGAMASVTFCMGLFHTAMCALWPTRCGAISRAPQHSTLHGLHCTGAKCTSAHCDRCPAQSVAESCWQSTVAVCRHAALQWLVAASRMCSTPCISLHAGATLLAYRMLSVGPADAECKRVVGMNVASSQGQCKSCAHSTVAFFMRSMLNLPVMLGHWPCSCMCLM